MNDDDLYNPAAWFAGDFQPGLTGEHEDWIARIEALKLRMLRAVADEWERADIVHELNALRAAFVFLAAQAPPPAATPAAPAAAPPPPLAIEGILGQHPVITRNLHKIARIAPSRMTILLEGETGAGKELFARIIHLNSKSKHLVTVNCGAFPPGIVESELFGHVKGAFTGATADRKGKFEEASGGTIFLDEIGDLELQVQVKLLRVLDAGELQRVGSDRIGRCDVRVIAATNRNLETMVRDGTFREDLFYRLNQCHLWIPPLRERRDEIPILLDYFVLQTTRQYDKPPPRLSPDLTEFLFERHDYPGNIRELKNIAEYVVLIHGDRPVDIADLPDRYQRANWDAGRETTDQPPHRAMRDEAERSAVIEMLRRCRGDVAAACREMRISRSRLYQLVKKYDLSPGDFRGGG